jgi:hypothetical protein
MNMPLRYPYDALQVNTRKIKRAITKSIAKTTQIAAKSAFKGKLMDQTVELRGPGTPTPTPKRTPIYTQSGRAAPIRSRLAANVTLYRRIMCSE